MSKIVVGQVGKRYFTSLTKKYESQIEEALANLELYFSKPVAIGEHSDLLTEHDKWVGVLDGATSKLETLNKYFELDGTPLKS